MSDPSFMNDTLFICLLLLLLLLVIHVGRLDGMS